MAPAAPTDENAVSDFRKEDRASPRPRIQAEITVDGETSGAGPCHVKDLSLSGISFTTSDPIGPGRAVCIRLQPPEGQITLTGVTTWVRPTSLSRYEVGCWHAPDGPESRERLVQLLGEHLTPLPTP